MKITIKTIKHSTQDYPTVGNWKFDKKGNLSVFVSKMGFEYRELAVAIHEIIEAYKCKQLGIKEEDVTNFDLNHVDADEPGLLRTAPYHLPHVWADLIERQVIYGFNENWADYEKAIHKL